MTSWVCVDANITLKLVLNESDSTLAENLWRAWLEGDERPAAPHLYFFEITSVLRKNISRGKIDTSYASQALRRALSFDVEIMAFPQIHMRALELANQLNRPDAYDTHYLAVADYLQCPFWTADEKLFNAANAHFSLIRWLGSTAISSS